MAITKRRSKDGAIRYQVRVQDEHGTWYAAKTFNRKVDVDRGPACDSQYNVEGITALERESLEEHVIREHRDDDGNLADLKQRFCWPRRIFFRGHASARAKE